MNGRPVIRGEHQLESRAKLEKLPVKKARADHIASGDGFNDRRIQLRTLWPLNGCNESRPREPCEVVTDAGLTTLQERREIGLRCVFSKQFKQGTGKDGLAVVSPAPVDQEALFTCRAR